MSLPFEPSDQASKDHRRENGLTADSFVPLVEVGPELGGRVLDALARARIAAYLEPGPDAARDRLFVASADRSDARTIVTSVSRGAVTRRVDASSGPTTDKMPDPSVEDPSIEVAHDPTSSALASSELSDLVVAPDLLHGRDTDAEFTALIADWHVDTVAAIRSAERDLGREDSDWRARLVPVAEPDDVEEHYVPPAPPPLPRLAGATIFALLVLIAGIGLLLFGGYLNLGGDVTFLLGIAGILLGAGLLVMRLRERPADEDDDGAIV